MPARAQAEANDTDELCDLDIIESRKATFTFQGKKHVIDPISTKRFFEFWAATQEYRKIDHGTPEAETRAYLKMLATVCSTIELKDVERMSIMQKASLVTHITGKVLGRSMTEALEKKNIQVGAPPKSA